MTIRVRLWSYLLKLSILIHKQGSNSFSEVKKVSQTFQRCGLFCVKGSLIMTWFAMKLPSRDTISLLSVGFFFIICYIFIWHHFVVWKLIDGSLLYRNFLQWNNYWTYWERIGYLNSFQCFSRLRVWWVIITTILYLLTPKSWCQQIAQSSMNKLLLTLWHNRLP